MPELPELEILRRELDAQVVGRRVVAVMADDATLAEGLVGAPIASVERRGKMLVTKTLSVYLRSFAPIVFYAFSHIFRREFSLVELR